MKIGRKKSVSWWPPLIGLGLVLASFAAGVWLGNAGWWAQLQQSWLQDAPRLLASPGAGLPVLALDVPFANYDALLSQRAEALEGGVFIGGEEDFVTADVTLDGIQVPVRLRLQQGAAVHLGENEKWNLDVRTRSDARLLGMTRFYLIDPADNNWLHEWAFLETMRQEGLLAVRYHFVRLRFNGDDWGIYAVQEGFAPELLTANDRPAGVILEFDAAPLWRSLRGLDGDGAAVFADPVTNLGATAYQFFAVDTFHDAAIARSATLSAQKETAVGMLRALQGDSLPAAEVFDVAQYGRFLALVDLWGATGATKLVNLRYYYHPDDGRLQPIAYNGNALGAVERISLAATYHDPDLQLAYARAAAQYSDPGFLAALQANLDERLIGLQQAVAEEAQVELPWEALASRQAQMRRSLDPVQPVFAYLVAEPDAGAAVRLDIANALNLPLEIVGFDVDGATFVEADPAWLPAGADQLLLPEMDGVVLAAQSGEETAVLRYARIELPLGAIQLEDSELDGLSAPTIWVVTRIPGSDATRRTAARPGYPEPFAGQAGE